MNDIAIFGAGGFGKEVACLINSINRKKPTWNFIGFFDDNVSLKGTRNNYGNIIGTINDLNNYEYPLGIVVAIGEPSNIYKTIISIKNNNITFPNLISPDLTELDNESCSIGKGNVIMFQSLISHNVCIGDFNVFNCGTSIGHDVKIGSFNSFMSYTKLSGNLTIGDQNFFGVGSVIIQNIKIGFKTTIGANSLILRDTKNETTYLGNPANALLKPKL